uniref:DUF8040 domain-containing protein n=1 Tax=Cajanus cajan TaxID=3821 RepID=A0A151UEX5_CAJCA
MKDWNEEYVEDQNEESTLISILQEDVNEAEDVSALISEYAIKYLCKEPCRSSDQTGHSWVQDILQGHPICCYEMFRKEKHVFNQLCFELVECGLKETKRMGVQEMVAMFLNMIGHGVGNRMIPERFQHSV